MIIISNSLPKSGSTITCLYTMDLMAQSGKRSGQAALQWATRRGLLSGVSYYVNGFTPYNVLVLLIINLVCGSFVVKTHIRPHLLVKLLLWLGLAKATYNYRDPRDVVLSAVDHCRRTQQSGKPEFQTYPDVLTGIESIQPGLKSTRAWLEFGHALFLRYELLIEDKATFIQQIADYLSIPATSTVIQEIIKNRETERSLGQHQLNKALLTRFDSEMTDAEKARCDEVLGEYLDLLGYARTFPQVAS